MITLPTGSPQLRPLTYSEVLRAPSSTKHRSPRHSTGRTSQSTFSPSLFSNKCPKRGTPQWRLLVRRLTLLIPFITHQPSPTIILHRFDPITNWLPISYHSASPTNTTDVKPSSHDSHFHLLDDLSVDWNDNTDMYNDHSDTITTDPISDTYSEDIPHPTTSNASDKYPNTSTTNSSTLLTSLSTHSHRPQYLMDISKIYSQNVHSLWCHPCDSAGNIIPHCDRDNTKLEHLIHWMRTNDIDAWLLQETWL
jgi:hypothetical protein